MNLSGKAASAWALVRDNPVSLALAVGVAGMGAWTMLTEWTFVVFGVALAGICLRRKLVRAAMAGRPILAWWAWAVAFAALSGVVTWLSHGSARQLHPTWFLLFMPVLTVAISTEARARVLLGAGAAVACMVLLALAVWQLHGRVPPLQRAAGMWNTATAFGITAALLSIGCLIALGLALRERTGHADDLFRSFIVRCVVCGAGLACGCLAVAMSASRGPFLGLVLAFTVAAWSMSGSALRGRSRLIVVLAAGMVAAALIAWILPGLIRGAGDLLAYFTQGKLATSEGERLSAWRSTWSLLTSSPAVPWIGLGHDHLDAALRAGFGGDGNRHFAMHMPHMHNDWLDVLVMRGVPALVALVSMQWAAVRWLAGVERGRDGSTWATWAFALSYAVMASVDAPYAWEGTALACACVLGLIAAPQSARQASAP